MKKFKAIEMTDLAKTIPGWKEMAESAISRPHDTEILAKMFELLDHYGEQNGMEFFQVHRRNSDNSVLAIFTLKN